MSTFMIFLKWVEQSSWSRGCQKRCQSCQQVIVQLSERILCRNYCRFRSLVYGGVYQCWASRQGSGLQRRIQSHSMARLQIVEFYLGMPEYRGSYIVSYSWNATIDTFTLLFCISTFSGDTINCSFGCFSCINLADFTMPGINLQTHSNLPAISNFLYSSVDRYCLSVIQLYTFSREQLYYLSASTACLTSRMLFCLAPGVWLMSQANLYQRSAPQTDLCLTRLIILGSKDVLIRTGSYSSIIIQQTIMEQRVGEMFSRIATLRTNNRFIECSQIMNEILTLYSNQYGDIHPKTLDASQKLCEYLNLSAMKLLQQDNYELSLQYLKRAQNLASLSTQSRATTFNNLACLYRRTGKLRAALSYLFQALTLQHKLQKPTSLSDTHLNMCAVLSQLSRHEQAHQHAMLSIILIQDELLQGVLRKLKEITKEKIVKEERMAVLAVAYHNLGVELEHLHREDQAVKVYGKALEMSVEWMPANKQLIRNLTGVVNGAKAQYQRKGEKDRYKDGDRRDASEGRRRDSNKQTGNTTRMSIKGRSSHQSQYNNNSSYIESSFSRNEVPSSNKNQPTARTNNYRIHRSKGLTPNSILSQDRKKSIISKLSETKTARQKHQPPPQSNCIIQP